MKNINIQCRLVFISLLLYTCVSIGAGDIVCRHNGKLSNASGRSIHMNMQNVSDGLAFGSGFFVIGYKLDKAGVNYTTVARVSLHMSNSVYWNFKNALQDIFVYKATLFLLDASGTVYSYNKSKWVLSSLKLKPNSNIIIG